MLENAKAVIFDLDGTLIDSMWMWNRIDEEYLARFDLQVPSDLKGRIEGMSFSETADYFKSRFLIPDSIEQIKHDWNQMAWDKYANEVELKEGVLDVLAYLKKHSVKLGIATSNSITLATLVLEQLGISKLFDAIHTSCEVDKGKPAPDIYLLVAKQLGVSPKDCFVFEDILQGIQGGIAAGMQVCAVYDDFSQDQDEEKRAQAHYYISTWQECLTGTYVKPEGVNG